MAQVTPSLVVYMDPHPKVILGFVWICAYCLLSIHYLHLGMHAVFCLLWNKHFLELDALLANQRPQ